MDKKTNKDLTFKLVRDTRFSHDKSPYNPAFRAHISAREKLPIPVGYYFVIKPGDGKPLSTHQILQNISRYKGLL